MGNVDINSNVLKRLVPDYNYINDHAYGKHRRYVKFITSKAQFDILLVVLFLLD